MTHAPTHTSTHKPKAKVWDIKLPTSAGLFLLRYFSPIPCFGTTKYGFSGPFFFSRIFEIIFFCFAVAIFDLVHDLEATRIYGTYIHFFSVDLFIEHNWY